MSSDSYNKFLIKKLKNNIFFILFIIVFIFVYTFIIQKNKNQNMSKIDKSPIIKGKHAILLLSSYGTDYLNNFLSQFNNDPRFDIYIHISGKSLIDFENGETIINSNIKYCNYHHKSERFSLGMVDAMYDIMIIASSKYDYDFYHFFSESCYLVKSLDYFYNFFEKNKLYTYVHHFLNNNYLYKNQSNLLYKGSQWMSINRDIMKKILEKKYLFKKYKNEIQKNIIQIINGAADEFFYQQIIVKDICENKPEKCNVINNNLRFIRWKNCSIIYCPHLLDISNVSEEEINYIKENILIIRKIKYKNPKAIELINKLKSLEK